MRTAVRRAAWAIAVAAAVALAVFLARAAAAAYPRDRSPFVADAGTWRGVYHVHTIASDGRGTVADVVAAARASGASWVLIADHNQLPSPRFQIVDGVLLVNSPEVSALHGHVTAVGASRALTREERRSEQALASIRALGGVPVAAHPLGRRRPYRQLDDPTLGGMEILSADQEFRDVLVSPFRLLPAALTYIVNPQHAVMRLLRRPDRSLARWDQLLAARRMAGFCAVDAHGRPPYAVMMSTLQMYAEVGRAPSGDAAADGAALVDALSGGRTFCGVEAVASAGGFRFTAVTSSGIVTTGGETNLGSAPLLRVDFARAQLPPGATPALSCAGAEVPMTEVPLPGGRRFEYRPERPGACRVEVPASNGDGGTWPWILSNPIYVR